MPCASWCHGQTACGQEREVGRPTRGGGGGGSSIEVMWINAEETVPSQTREQCVRATHCLHKPALVYCRTQLILPTV